MTDFSGKLVWLTGASAGIGESVARELAGRGAILALTARRPDPLNQLVAELTSKGHRAYGFRGDVTSTEDMTRVVREIEAQLGTPDIVIANAGTHIPSDPIQFNGAEYLSIMDTNFGGMIKTIEAVIGSMVRRKSGHIVGVSSMAGYRGLPTSAAYSASKAAVTTFLESCRFHLEEVGISVSIVHPGFVRTPLTDKNTFSMPFLMEAPAAAKVMCDGIANKRKEISFPFPFNWIMRCIRVLPYPLFEILARKSWKLTLPR